MYPAELPDLFKGDQLVLAGRYTGSGEVEAKLTGNAAGHEQTFTYKVHFEDRNSGNDFVPRLWATRRVGFLLDEIRVHGETGELREEATELARKFGIVTPYTAYLIVEDEDRRRVPMAQRSMQEMTADAPTRANAAKAWSGFKDKMEGDDGVANARSQNAFKYAQQPAASISSAASESLRGFALAAPMTSDESQRATQYVQQSRFVNGRAFYQNGKQWIDAGAQRLTNRQRVQFNSPEYFELLKNHPEAAPWLALGQNVQVALGDTVYDITE
jgi:Ca-activated chloride channel family protein